MDESRCQASGQLLRVFDKNGRKFGVIQIDCRLAVIRIAEMEFSPPLDGNLIGTIETAIDGSSSSSTFKQTSTIRGNSTLIKGDMEVKTVTQFDFKSMHVRTEDE